jgi:hypothetical protein
MAIEWHPMSSKCRFMCRCAVADRTICAYRKLTPLFARLNCYEAESRPLTRWAFLPAVIVVRDPQLEGMAV